MQKGYKRQARGMAVLRCFIGLFSVIIIVLVAYFYLQVDYSDKLDPNASVRPYVETTLAPDATEPVASAEASAQPVATATVKPTAKPTATPSPSPTPEPTPAPTSMVGKASAMKFDGFVMPGLSTLNGKLGITHSFRSSVDGNKMLQLQGYAYVDDATFDASTAQMFLVVTQVTNGNSALVLPTMVDGISGVDHSAAVCANASAGDFEAFIDVSNFPDEIYSLGVILAYTGTDGANHLEYFKFPDETSFTVLGAQIVTDVAVTD